MKIWGLVSAYLNFLNTCKVATWLRITPAVLNHEEQHLRQTNTAANAAVSAAIELFSVIKECVLPQRRLDFIARGVRGSLRLSTSFVSFHGAFNRNCCPQTY